MKINKKTIGLLYAVLIVVNIVLWGFVNPYLNRSSDDLENNNISMLTDHSYNSTSETKDVDTDVIEYRYGVRTNPSVYIDPTEGIRNNTNNIDTSKYRYLGQFDITGYTPGCEHCCGNIKGITASGVEAIPGYTVAADKSIPFGTTLFIEGYGFYVVEDRGAFDSGIIDIAASSHEECYTLTDTNINVYIVPYE